MNLLTVKLTNLLDPEDSNYVKKSELNQFLVSLNVFTLPEQIEISNFLAPNKNNYVLEFN